MERFFRFGVLSTALGAGEMFLPDSGIPGRAGASTTVRISDRIDYRHQELCRNSSLSFMASSLDERASALPGTTSSIEF